VSDLIYRFILAGLFLQLYPAIPGSTGVIKGLNYSLIFWFLRVVMGVISQWMMYTIPLNTHLYCMEAFDENGSKANALIRLKNLLKVNHVIAFGDNLNDMGMMKAADACYATANAIDEVKELATRVIGSCDEDGVALFIDQQPI